MAELEGDAVIGAGGIYLEAIQGTVPEKVAVDLFVALEDLLKAVHDGHGLMEASKTAANVLERHGGALPPRVKPFQSFIEA